MVSKKRSTLRRRARPKRGSRRAGGNSIWYLVIGICVLAIFGIFAGSQTLLSNSKINKVTLCHSKGPINVTAILLDLTDPLNDTQQARLKVIIENEIATSSTDTMIALGVVSEDPTRWGAMFAKCKPATGEAANALYENPKLISAQYTREFLMPIREKLDASLQSEVEDRSPIMEALQSLIASTPDFVRVKGQRKLLVVSDMLQNSDELSFYRLQGWEYFTDQGFDGRLAENLSNVFVEILRIPRTGDNAPPSDLVEGFWARYFDRQGSRAPSVSTLGDL